MTSQRYQMIYNDGNGKDTQEIKVKEFVEMDFKDDFYPMKDGSNGIIAKLNVEGDLYKMCGDECKCFVECVTNIDCGDGMKCNDEFKCEKLTDVNQLRKETMKERSERKVVPQVTFAIPLAICTFGIFTSMYLAEKYAQEYFDDKCKEMCYADYLAVTNTEKIGEKYRRYFCTGKCKLERTFDERMKEKINNGQITLKPYFEETDFIKKVGGLCEGILPEKDLYAMSEKEAITKYFPFGHLYCEGMHLIEVWGFKNWKDCNMCEIDEDTIQCNLRHTFIVG